MSLLRHADRVHAANLAQLVNVIAPIMTEPGGAAWRQTTFYPFAVTSRLARGASLRVPLDTPTYSTSLYGPVNVVDAAATYDEATHRAAVFLVNRSTTEPASITIDARALGAQVHILEALELADADPYAKNTLQQPDRVAPHDAATDVSGGLITVALPPMSWAALSLG